MDIKVLDGILVNPGDLSWSSISELGSLTVFERTTNAELSDHLNDVEILLTNKVKVSRDIIYSLPKLKYIGEMATGYDNIDIRAASERGIPVCNVPGYSTSSVAQLTWSFILDSVYHPARRSEEVHRGDWVRSKDFSFGQKGLFELQGKTIALIGLGKIGIAVAEVAKSFGMNIIANVRDPSKHKKDEGWIRFTTLNECFGDSDFISLHCPLTKETQEMVNQSLIKLMKPTAVLINTARGRLVNENDLAVALNEGKISGVYTDVLSSEPPSAANPLLNARNCVITPHIGWGTKESRMRLIEETARNISGFLNGHLRNVVNGNF